MDVQLLFDDVSDIRSLDVQQVFVACSTDVRWKFNRMFDRASLDVQLMSDELSKMFAGSPVDVPSDVRSISVGRPTGIRWMYAQYYYVQLALPRCSSGVQSIFVGCSIDVL